MINKFTSMLNYDKPNLKYYIMGNDMVLYVCGINDIYSKENDCENNMKCKCYNNINIKHCKYSFTPIFDKILEYANNGKLSEKDFFECFSPIQNLLCHNRELDISDRKKIKEINLNIVYIDKEKYKKYLEKKNKININIDDEIINFEKTYLTLITPNSIKQKLNQGIDPIKDYKDMIYEIMVYNYKIQNAPMLQHELEIIEDNKLEFVTVINNKEPNKPLYIIDNEYIFMYCDKNNKIFRPIMNSILDTPNKSYMNIDSYSENFTDKFFCSGNDYNLLKNGGKYSIVSLDIDKYILNKKINTEDNSIILNKMAYNEFIKETLNLIYSINGIESKIKYQKFIYEYLIYSHHNIEKPIINNPDDNINITDDSYSLDELNEYLNEIQYNNKIKHKQLYEQRISDIVSDNIKKLIKEPIIEEPIIEEPIIEEFQNKNQLIDLTGIAICSLIFFILIFFILIILILKK